MADQTILELIQEDNHIAFNNLVADRSEIDLTDAQFRGYDLRKFHLNKANLGGCYFRNTDLRGLDLSNANLDGASIKGAHISGTLFPKQYRADELMLSFAHGTRLRRQ